MHSTCYWIRLPSAAYLIVPPDTELSYKSSSLTQRYVGAPWLHHRPPPPHVRGAPPPHYHPRRPPGAGGGCNPAGGATAAGVERKRISRQLLLAMVTKHFGAGSECPPLPPGMSRIYSMEYCPYAQRARLVALAKNLPHDVVNINLKNKPDWFLQMYPEGKIPVLQHKDDIIGDSIQICDYLETKIPRPTLANMCYRKSDQKMRKDWGRIVGLMTRITFGNNLRSEGGVNEVVCKLHRYLKPFENVLLDRNTIYFNGDVPGIMDYIIWPHFERFCVIYLMEDPFKYHGHSLPPLDESKLPLLTRWARHMSNREEVQQTRHKIEKHFKMVQMYKSGDVDYDSL